MGGALGVAQRGRHDTPLVGPGAPGLVAAPADVRAADRDHRTGLPPPDDGVVALPVVRLARAVRAGAVEPHREHLAVAGQQLLELADEEIVVRPPGAVRRFRAVPGREVDAEPETVSPARIR